MFLLRELRRRRRRFLRRFFVIFFLLPLGKEALLPNRISADRVTSVTHLRNSFILPGTCTNGTCLCPYFDRVNDPIVYPDALMKEVGFHPTPLALPVGFPIVVLLVNPRGVFGACLAPITPGELPFRNCPLPYLHESSNRGFDSRGGMVGPVSD